jgi:tetratricopeptide (TPR) repeat protein
VAVEMCGRTGDPQALVQRSAIHRAAGDPAKAATDWAKATEMDPKLGPDDRAAVPAPPKPPGRTRLTAETARELAAALAAFDRAWPTGDGPGCRKAAEDAVRIDPTSAAARSARARIRAQDGKFEEARADATEAIRLDPGDGWAYSSRAAARVELNDPAGGIADATIALRLDPGNALTWNTRGWAYLLRGQYHQAVVDAARAIELRPGFALPHHTRGKAYAHLGDYPKALTDYEAAARIQPTHAQWRLACSALRTRLGDPDGAARDREQAIKINGQLANEADVVLPDPIPPVKQDPD